MSNDMSLDVPFDLDGSLDDIETLPGFLIPLSGAYIITCTGYEQKKVNDKPAIELMHNIDNVLELTETPDLGDSPPKVGDKFSQLFFLDNKVGVHNLKKYLEPISKKLNISSEEKGGVRKGLEAMKGMQAAAIITREPDKENKNKKYARIKHMSIE
jgi:hypothetical protein